MDTYRTDVESIVQKLRTKMPGLDEATLKLLSENLDALHEHAETVAVPSSPSGAGSCDATAAEQSARPRESEEDEGMDDELAATLLWKAVRRWREWPHARDKRSRSTRRTPPNTMATTAAAAAAAPAPETHAAPPLPPPPPPPPPPPSAWRHHERAWDGDDDPLAQSWLGPSLSPSEYLLESDDPLARSVGDPFARSYGRRLGQLGGLLGQQGLLGLQGLGAGGFGFGSGDSGGFGSGNLLPGGACDDESNVPGSDCVAMHEL